MIEIWKDIIDYPNYQVSNLGNVKSIKTNKVLKPFSPVGEYLKVSLSKNGKDKQFFIHRLVATAFIPNPNNLPEVNHIKEFEKTNNKVENLEWCTQKNNVQLYYKNKKIKKFENEVAQLKEVIEEVREYVEDNDNFELVDLYSQSMADGIQKELLQILDKVKENK